MADERKSENRKGRSRRTGQPAPEKSQDGGQPGPDRAGEERWRGRSAEPDSWVGQPGGGTEGPDGEEPDDDSK